MSSNRGLKEQIERLKTDNKILSNELGFLAGDAPEGSAGAHAPAYRFMLANESGKE